MFNVLVAEDDYNICRLIEIKLKNAGYSVVPAVDGEDALCKFHENHIDIMVVDAMMPKKDGFEFVKELRLAGDKTPVIMCTALGSIDDKAAGFSLGVDDYMVKPVDFDELIMRIKAILRRANMVSDRKLTVGSVTLHYDVLAVYDDKTRVQLTKKECCILFKLLAYPEKTFSKSQIFEEFWDFASDAEEDSVKVYVNKIRNKIECFKEIDIDTVRGVGYRGIRNE